MLSFPCCDSKRLTVLPKYSFTNIKGMEPLIDARIQAWISKLSDEFAKTGQKFDFAPWAV